MTLYWPHETEFNTSDFENHLKDFTRRYIAAMSIAAHIRVTPRRRRWRLHRDYAHAWFKILNGTCPLIYNKHEFTLLAQSAGCSVPADMEVWPDASTDPSELYATAEALNPSSPIRFCKPLYGAGGRGLHIAPTSAEAIEFALRSGIPYLVTEFLPPVYGEWRYILHRTTEDLLEGNPPSVRIAASKLGPTVVGDGAHTVRELIAEQRSWSVKDRRKLLMAAPAVIPALDEHVQLVNSGNISLKLFRFAEPPADKLAEVDEFMLRFLTSLEMSYGRKFATVCFDLGFTERGIMPYELQFPFANPYGKSFGGTGSHHRVARQEFQKSLYLSGQVA